MKIFLQGVFGSLTVLSAGVLKLVLLLILTLPALVQAQFSYEVRNGSITITRSDCVGISVSIPSTIDDLPVTSIGDNAFRSCTKLTSVTIPSSVTSITGGTFRDCTSLTSVTIPNGVAWIGDHAFEGCILLTNVTIPSNVTYIGSAAFSGCSSLTAITVDADNSRYSSVDGVLFEKSLAFLIQCPASKTGNYTIPKSVTDIGDAAFQGCTSLANVTIPSGVTFIRDGAFRGCTSLTSLTIPSSVTYIGSAAFSGCSSLTAITVDADNSRYSSVDGVLFEKSLAFLIQCPASKTGNYTIPSSVTSIGNAAFYGCTSLTSVTIPGSVTSIADGTFQGCTSLASVMIPSSVTSIGNAAFQSCTRLASVTIPSTVTYIGDAAFSGCSSLTAITVDANNSRYSSVDGVLFEKSLAFLIQCPGGKTGNYSIPSSVASIGNAAFYGCTGLASITIPNRVSYIGSEAFHGCTGLAIVTIPSRVTSISYDAFGGCTSLTAVYFQGNAPIYDGTVFSSADKVTVYYLPGTTGWKPTFDGRPTSPWVLPDLLILTSGPSFGAQAKGFSFVISWATNTPVVVEACTNLVAPLWTPVATNAFANGSSSFRDPQWTKYPKRFYRLRAL